MKTIAITQPYIFPYIGYFQLFEVADVFISHDDVQYMKGGCINRNRILFKGKPKYITFPVKKGHSDSLINEYYFADKTLIKEKFRLLLIIRLKKMCIV